MVDQPLSFGTFTFGNLSQAMEVTVNTDGSFNSNANTTLISDPTNGEYTISDGTASAMYSITVPLSVALDGPGTNDLTIDQVSVDPTSGTFDGFGVTTISVGGRLRSSGGGVQYDGGDYTGTIDIIFNY